MYSVLIVDDEKPVIESITFMLKKYRPELQIAGTATSGREAIQRALELKPDIICIDVKMPGIDGLEALREIKRRLPFVMPILTTAYERFDIAQTAFELGVQDYILKPFTQEKLIGAVDAAVKNLDRNISGQGEGLKHIELLHSLQGSIEQLFFKAVRLSSGVEEFLPFLQATLSLHGSRGCIGLLVWGECDKTVEERTSLGHRLLSQLKYKFSCLGSVSPDEIIFFFPERTDAVSVPGDGYLRKLMKMENGESDGWFFAAGDFTEFSRLSISFWQAQRETRERLHHPDRQEKWAARIPEWRRFVEESIVQKREEDLEDLVKTEILLIEDFNTVKGIIMDLALNVEHLHHLSTLYPIEIAGANTREELYVLSIRWFSRLVELVETMRDDSMPHVLRKALEYLDLNYSRIIQLSDVAAHVEVSSAYLSNLFSCHLGRSFTDHLTEYRIERAKQLLSEGHHSVKSISHMVGYHDPNYFSRLFKKQTGQSPTEYSP